MTDFMYIQAETNLYQRFHLCHPMLQFTVIEKENRSINFLYMYEYLRYNKEGIVETVKKNIWYGKYPYIN